MARWLCSIAHVLNPSHEQCMEECVASAVKYGLEKMNEEVAAWMLGLITEDGTKSRPPFLAMGSSQSVMWNRDFGQERFKNLQQRWKACMDVEGMLKLLGARQLIIGHTPQVALHSTHATHHFSQQSEVLETLISAHRGILSNMGRALSKSEDAVSHFWILGQTIPPQTCSA